MHRHEDSGHVVFILLISVYYFDLTCDVIPYVGPAGRRPCAFNPSLSLPPPTRVQLQHDDVWPNA